MTITTDQLLAGATHREPLRREDGLSNVPMERLVVDGQRCVLKHLSWEGDWVMRFSQDTRCRPAVMHDLGLYERVAPWVDPLVLGVGYDEATATWSLLMRDASDEFIDEGSSPITPEQQAGFLRDMAGLHAGMWGFQHVDGLCRPEDYYAFFSPASLAREEAQRPLAGVPSYTRGGWDALASLEPALADDVQALLADVTPFTSAQAETPQTLVHHDWKGGNLGIRPDGRTLLVDWAFPGSDAGLSDIGWYLAVNCDRLVTSKEQVVADYRAALEREGVETAGWFDRQLELALLGSFLVLGWSKTGDAEELAWWVDRVAPVAKELAR